MNAETIRDITSQVFTELADTDIIEDALANFLLQFPHLKKHKQALRRESLLAGTACALSAAFISLGCCRTTANDHQNYLGAGESVADRLFAGLPDSDLAEIATYLESFNYIYSQQIRRDCPMGHELQSPLANMAFLAATRMCGNNAYWKGASFQISPIIHDFVFPLLVEVFNRFSSQRKSAVMH